MSRSLIKHCIFLVLIFSFPPVTAASESAMKGASSVVSCALSPASLKDQCIAVLHNHSAYLEPDRYGAQWREKSMPINDQENRLIALDQLRTSWCVQKVKAASTIYLQGHSDIVLSIAYNHDGTQLASGSGDCTIRLWDPVSGTCLHVLKGHVNSVRSVAYNHDSTQFASGSADRTVRLWNPVDGACLRVLEGHSGWISSVAYNRDGTLLASKSWDKAVRLWNPVYGHCVPMPEGYVHNAYSIAYNYGSIQLPSGLSDDVIQLWNKVESSYLGMYKETRAYSHDGTQIALGSRPGFILVWPILRETHLTSLSHEERLFLFKALIEGKQNEYCSAIITKLSGLKLVKPFKKSSLSFSFAVRSACEIC